MTTARRGQTAYRQIAEDLRNRIARGDLRPGSKLPSEAALAEEFGVARGTVRQALTELERDGLVATEVGRGRRVAGSDSQPPTDAKYERIAADLRRRIGEEEFPVGSPLPSVASLTQEYGAAIATVRNAVSLLVTEGILEVRHGSGTFVCKRPARSRS